MVWCWWVNWWTLGYYLLRRSFWDNFMQIFFHCSAEWIVWFQKMYSEYCCFRLMSRRCCYRWPLSSCVVKQPLCSAYVLWTSGINLPVPLVSCLWITVLSSLLTIHFCIDRFSGVQLILESMVPVLSSSHPSSRNKNNYLLCSMAPDKLLSGFHSYFCD